MAERAVEGLMGLTIDKVREIVDSDTIIGKPIVVGEITIIPVSKVSFGLASGGSEFPAKNSNAKMFGGGGGAGATVTPVCFIVVKGNEVKMLNPNSTSSPIEKAIDAVPGIVDKISGLFKKDKNEDEELIVD